MQSFEGFLDRVVRTGDTIQLRIVADGFDPMPESTPVALVTVHGAERSEALYATLLQSMEVDEGCFIVVRSDEEAVLSTDHGNEISLRGTRISFAPADYDARDFQRLAKQNHKWGESQYVALVAQTKRLQALRALILMQSARLSVKIERHAVGTTPHTLYKQQIAFLTRLLTEFDT